MTTDAAMSGPGHDEAAVDQGGFTLVELVVAMVIMMLLIGPIVAGIIVGLNTTGAASTRLSQSDDRQLLELWLPRDVASTQHVIPGTTTPGATANVVITSSAANCAYSQGITSGTAALVLQGQGVNVNTSSNPTTVTPYTYEADYVLSGSGTAKHLVRYFCTPYPPPGTAQNTSTTVAYGLTSATGSVPVGTPASPSTISLTVIDTAGNTTTISGLERS